MFKKNKQKELPPPSAPNPGQAAIPDRLLSVRAIDEVLAAKYSKGAVIKLYLETFKRINDTFGHAFGEALLSQIDNFLRSMPGVRVLRYSGVEFLILLDRCGVSDATGALEEIRERFELPWRVEGMDYLCVTAMGMVFYPDYVRSAEEALRALDYAVLESEGKEQNQPVVFDAALAKKLFRRRSIAQGLLNFQAAPEMIEIRYRPTYSRDANCFTRAECAARLLSPEFGEIQAAEFLPIAEDSGVICPINRYIIEQACRQIRRLLDTEAAFESIVVPVSPVQFMQEGFVPEMQALLERYAIPPGKLGFEIMETAIVNSSSRINIVMQELGDIGIEMVLNEFGTGYSGIQNILDLPVDVLKLERYFIWQLESNERSGCLIEGLIRIANGLGLKLIAEGVETENQVQRLSDYGCRYMQGFYFSPTVTREELERLFTQPRAN